MVNRGIVAVDDARRFLAPRLAELHRPEGDPQSAPAASGLRTGEMRGFRVAADRLMRALQNGETIGVFGDYDVDGVTSCATLTLFLRGVGGRVVPRVASRDAGYGFGVADVEAFADARCGLIITCDLGTSDHDALAAARSRQIDVIIVDHHQVPDRDPDALALLNPHHPDCRFPFKGLASVGVAFYLAAALRTRLKSRPEFVVPDPRGLLDLVAVGTIADMAPLTGDNRILVRHGLTQLHTRPGLRALAEIANLTNLQNARASDVSMRLGPRLNAPGRLGGAQLALDLLLSDDDESARALAFACETQNQRRRDIQAGVLEGALAQAEQQRDRPALVVGADGWHPGVVGIVAAQLVERFARPAVVIGFADGVGRGSARTAGTFHLQRAFAALSDVLIRHGGHRAAAGLTIRRVELDGFARRLCELAQSELGGAPPRRQLPIDARVPLDLLSTELGHQLESLHPCGVGNAEPLLGTRAIVERKRLVGDGKHLQITLSDGRASKDGIGFYFPDAFELGADVEAAFVPELDSFRGQERLRLRLRDLRAPPVS